MRLSAAISLVLGALLAMSSGWTSAHASGAAMGGCCGCCGGCEAALEQGVEQAVAPGTSKAGAEDASAGAMSCCAKAQHAEGPERSDPAPQNRHEKKKKNDCGCGCVLACCTGGAQAFVPSELIAVKFAERELPVRGVRESAMRSAEAGDDLTRPPRA